ncbi:thioredoxin family protein [Portibacter lacus]|uniref:DUF255 domain-containing protein n=1 Tax=Portibacter lacus TaxID=1099794 RepID=A0AA37SWJ8_9BACT|nr:thioredoxin family protein [Portibacter lacus]GLR19173.1 hypothetical protein GCM10007940_37890 [Portibacter lacus]
MRMITMMLCLLFLYSANAENNPNSIHFFDGDFESAKMKAGDEGKLFFVDFYATWCTPCKWMEETTFNDTEVVGLLTENYVSLKIDIDDLDGYSIKERFQVSVLPTILIFNSSGELVARVEETLSSRNMAKLLTFHNKDENKIQVKHSINSSPKTTISDSYKSYTKQKVAKPSVNTTKPANQKFRIQLGVFKEFENTYDMVNALKSKFLEPVIVLNDYADGKVVYKVMMGAFETKEEATGFKNILKEDFSLEGLVK